MKTTFTRYLFQKYAKSILFTATFLALVFQGLGQSTENYDGADLNVGILATGDTPFDYGGLTYQIAEVNGLIEDAKISKSLDGQGGSYALGIFHYSAVEQFKIKKTDGGIFDAASLWIGSWESVFTITGYRDGISTTSSVMVYPGISIVELNFTEVDELRFEGVMDFYIDDFQYTLTTSTPTISINNSTLAYTENDAATKIDASGTVSDANGDADWNGGTLEVQITANNEAADEISIPDNVVGTINTSGTTILNATTAIGTLSASEGTVTNGTILTITFNASATDALVQQVLQALHYRNTSNDPGRSNRTITITATDKNAANDSDTRTIRVTAINDEPTLTASELDPTFTEGGSAASLFSSASASTIESGQTFSSFTMTVSNVNDGSYERLNLDGSTIVLTHITSGTTATNSLSYSVSVSGTTATLSLSGGTLSVSALQTLINSISYQNNSNDPNTSNRVVTLTSLTDSGSNLGSNDNIVVLSITSIVSVTAVNEVPTANDFTLVAIYQGTPYTFAASDFAYSDDNSDPIDHIRITAVPINGTLYVDANSNDAYDSGEELSNGSTVTKANLDAGNLQYINTGTSNSSFTFDVNDGIDYSTSSYTASLTIIVKPTVTLSLDPSSSISENGGTTNIKATLSHVFNKAVTVNLAVTGTAAGAGTDYNLSASSIVINSGSTSNTITITGVDDDSYEDDESIIADISTVTNGYEYASQQVTCILTDDDVTGFTITQTDGNTQVLESGTDDSFTVQLDVIPASDVVIDLANGNTGEISMSPSSLTFTAGNWNVPQVVNLTTVDDDYDDGDQSVNITISINDDASDDAFDALPNQTLGVTSVDDDTTGFSLSKLTASVTEDGSTDNISIALDTRPASDVVLTISSSDETEATVLPAILTFTSENWSTEQVITLSGQDDAVTDGNQISTITVSVDDAGSDDAFDSLADQIVSCTTTDDEVADFIIVESVGYTHVNERGTSDVFSLRLAGAPLSDVVLSVSSSDTGEASVDKATLTFTSANWNTPQPVTVTGVNDALTDGEQIVTITIAVVDASSHDAFDSVADKQLSVTNADNDTAGFTISQTNGSASVSENEYITLDTMWVVLNSLPSSNVVLSFVSSNEDEVLVDKYRYYYSPGNWNIPQRFLIGGMNDNFVDGDTTTPLTIGVIDAESPADYNLLPDQIINVINADNDVAAFSLSKTTATLAESGTETFTLHLENRPLSDVVFHISAGDSDEVLVSPSSLTFTTAEGWRSKKTITITGVDDSLLDGNQLSTITVSVDPDNSNDFFDALPDQTVTVTTTDNNVAALAIVESNGNSSLEETGSTDSFTVALRAQPDSDVVINIANADAGELSVTPASLTFTSANWNTPQTVSLTGVDDLFDDGAQFTQVTLSVDAANSDDLFDSMSNQIVDVITADDDSSPVITAIQSFSVDEDAANTTSVGTVLASDADAGTTFSSWTITSGNDDAVFAIDASSGAITIADNTNLDFETTTSYTLSVTVSDGTNTSLLETVSVTINDINDELPVVTASLSFSVDENAANTTSVGTVLASDADAGTSFSTWTIAGGNADAIFEINTATGEITIADNTNLDFETTTSYALEISVSDGTNTSLLETVSVTINDINDELPVVIANQSFSVDEDVANTASVGTVLASDADAGTSFSNWTIAGGNTDGIFEINTATGEITIADNTNLDFEMTQNYSLKISLSDGTNTSIVEDVIININDINDNTPVVTANQSFSVDENAANTTSVGTVLASDADAGTSFSNWTITNGNSDAVFEINTATGEITIADNTNLDFETTTSYTLSVTVSDGTNTSLLETLSISIDNINDELPVVTASLSFSVNEDAANTASVGTISATDADSGTTLNNWSIESGNDDAIFEINTATGEITIADNSSLDFETTQTYTLEISVSDGTNTSLPETVIVDINDVNEAPTALAGENQTVAGEVIATLDGSASTDPEGDELSYYWTAPEGITLSDINAAQPTFTTPKLNETTDIEFSLIVNDGEFDSQESIVTVTVELITGINDFSKNSEIIVYPNPSKGEFTIRLTETPQNGAMFTLSNLNGQIIHKKTIYQKETWFNLSLAPGLYLIKIIQDNKVIIKKLLIQ